MTAPTPEATIRDHIKRHGAISIADYMAFALDGYYARGDVFGRGGDFITAPEISQTFGEIIGLWCAVTWQSMGRPNSFVFAECGPGRGTLMADALRATKAVPGFVAAAHIHLVERSPALRKQQRAALADLKVTWHDTIETLPPGPMILIGNEFLDAMPIRQFQRTTDGWAERVIAMDASGALCFSTQDVASAPIPIPLAISAEQGAIFEHADAVKDIVDHLARRLSSSPGAAIFIDYGHVTSSLGDTLQALKAHVYHNVLNAPGSADITAHVDFDLVKRTARAAGASVYGPLEQGIWLRQLGIGVRQLQLAKGKPADVAASIEQGVRRLTEPHGMGVLFKVVAMAHPSLGPLEGFPT
jgi:NADH dehydrogenase [ubiquinone] 1 alpha subcomplex assembly factor 7